VSRAGRLAVCTLGLVLAAAPALAVELKTRKLAPGEKAPAAPEAPADNAPPYEAQLLRLSEIMGALAFLRDLCGDGDGGEYRTRMANLLDAEAGARERREKLAGAYNRGYRGYETTYRVCTPNARTTIARFVEEGGRLARDISYRFGGT
jgi:uncharacterized protein (TIGR02301 family)